MTQSTAQLIIDRLNEKINMDYCMLNEAEVIEIIIKAEEEALKCGLETF